MFVSIIKFIVVPLFMVQAGDITNFDGTGGESIYGENFPDEKSILNHDEEGMVGMANNGKHTNNSQFYITTVPCPHLDGINVVFGKIRKGLNLIVEMSDLPRASDTPLEPITIVDCGELRADEPWNIGEMDGSADIYPPWPNDWDLVDPINCQLIETAINRIKDSGNDYFRKNNYIDSERKYKKTLRYIDWYVGLKTCGDWSKVSELKANALLNLATVRHKMGRFREAIELCSQVISGNGGNGKAYYRRAQARLGLKDYDKALSDLNMAVQLHPNDRSIQHVLKTTKKYRLNYLMKEKRVYSKLFT